MRMRRRWLPACVLAAVFVLGLGGVLALLLLQDPFDARDTTTVARDSETTQTPHELAASNHAASAHSSSEDAADNASATPDVPKPAAEQVESSAQHKSPDDAAQEDERWPGAALSGRVVTPEGGTLAGAHVALVDEENLQRLGNRRNRRYQPPVTVPAGVETVRSDDDGHFRIPLDERWVGRGWVMAVAEAPHSAGLEELGRHAYLSRSANELAQPQSPLDVGEIVVPLGASVDGRVTDAETGEPLAGARVLAGGYREHVEAEPYSYRTRRGAVETTTDDEGHFHVAGVLPEERIFVRVEAQGYLHQQQDVELEPGEARRDFDFELETAPSLLVRVKDEDAEPLDGVRITLSFGNVGETDAAGEARFEGFPQRTVRVSAHKRGYRAEGRQRPRLRLVPGETITHDITMIPAAVVSLRPVDATSGTPLFGEQGVRDASSALTARVYGETQRGARWRRARFSVAEDGTLLWQRRNWSNVSQLEVWPLGYERRAWPLSLAEGEGREFGDVPFESGTQVLVELLDTAGAPLDNMHVEARVFQRNEDDTNFRMRSGRDEMRGFTDDDGQWKSPPVHGDAVQVRIRHLLADEDGRVRWIRVLTHTEPLDVSQQLVHVRLTVDPEAGFASVRGTAFGADGAPLVGQWIHLLNERGRRSAAQTDEQGRFRIVTRREGRFRLTTRPHRRFFERHSFELRRGEHMERDYHQTEDFVSGRLLWHDGTPASGLLVTFQWGEMTQLPAHQLGRTDGSGRFELLERRRGRRTPSDHPATLRVEVEPGRVVNARLAVDDSAELGEFRLPPLERTQRGALTVRLVEADTGRPVSGRVDVRGQVDAELVWRRQHATGEVRFDDLPAGRLRVTVRSGEHLRRTQSVEVASEATTEHIFEVQRRVDAHFHVLLDDEGVAGAGRALVRVRVEALAEEDETSREERGRHGSTLRIRHLRERSLYEATITCRGYQTRTIRFEAQASSEPMNFDVVLYPAIQE